MLKPRQFGRYILVDRISAGGMAEVYLAKSSGVQGFEKVVAIKRILPSVSEDPDFETMFIDEAKISARLAHSNIGQVFEFGQVDGQYYIAMEYIPGKDLRAIQTHLEETDRVMAVRMALHIISRLCQALDYAHRQKDQAGTSMEIIHRDISPPNVIVTFDGAVKLIDFGIAKATSRATRTRAGKLKGKFAYMSPEQVQGMPIDHRSDVFSIGTLLHELLTNQRLFQGESQLAVMQAVRRAEVAAPSAINPEVPLEVDKIALRALARDRDERYGWASELRADIERFFARSGIVFDSPQLTEWMQAEFAGDVLAERHLRERLHGLTLDQAATDDEPPGTIDMDRLELGSTSDEVEDQGLVFGAEIAAVDGEATAAEAPALGEMLPTDQQQALPDFEPETVRHVLDTDRRPLELDTDDRRATDRDMGIDPSVLRDDGPDTDRHELQGGPPGEIRPVDGELEPEESDTELDSGAPRVIGPSGQKDRRELVNWPTQFNASDEHEAPAAGLDVGPTRIEPAPPQLGGHAGDGHRGSAIAPGPDRDGATVGGALEVDSNPDREVSDYPSDPAVDVAGIDGVVKTSEVVLPEIVPRGSHISGTQELGEQQRGAKRFSSMHVIVITAGLTLLIAGLISVPLLVCNGTDETTDRPVTAGGGTIVVNTRPPTTCSVSLDRQPKGLLQPGATLSLPRVPAGRHEVELVCGGFETYKTSVKVQKAGVAFVDALLKKEKE